jgi:hypothetical protein
MLANNVVVCSKCGMRAHRGGQENSIKCRWCNTTYTGAGRRYYQRLNKKMKGTLRKKGGFPIAVLTENISNKGVMVRYVTNASVYKDSTLYFNTDGLDIQEYATVVWTSPLNDKESHAGLRFIVQ